jgi:hypothetical protein
LTTLAGVASGTFGRTLLGESTAASARSDLGLGGLAVQSTVDLTSNVVNRLPAANLANTTVTAGTYGNATTVPQITIDQQGRATNVTNITISGGGGGGTGNSQVAFSTANFDKTDDTLADITGLTLNLVSGTTYAFRARLHCTCDSSDGIKIQMGGTCSASAVYRSVYVYDLDTFGNSFAGHADAVGISGWTTFTGGTNADIIVEGTIVCDGSGTITMQAAENTSSGGTTATVLAGSMISTLSP